MMLMMEGVDIVHMLHVVIRGGPWQEHTPASAGCLALSMITTC